MLLAPAPLADMHQLDDFDLGVPALDDWLKRRARANHISGASRTYVSADDDGTVVAYYAIASGALAAADAPGRLKRNVPDPIPMAILGRLAIDKRRQGEGLGAAMLRDAVLRVRQAAAIMRIRGLLVHAISDEAQAFYERHGFVGAPAHPMTLVMSIAEPR
ncbi:MAG: GNAT family N-acetyltransferase [Beijerinckiaceae bacterium]